MKDVVSKNQRASKISIQLLLVQVLTRLTQRKTICSSRFHTSVQQLKKIIHQSTFYTLLFNYQNMTENVCRYAFVIQRGYTSMQQRNTKFNKRQHLIHVCIYPHKCTQVHYCYSCVCRCMATILTRELSSFNAMRLASG